LTAVWENGSSEVNLQVGKGGSAPAPSPITNDKWQMTNSAFSLGLTGQAAVAAPLPNLQISFC